jgi:hypothetical protein
MPEIISCGDEHVRGEILELMQTANGLCLQHSHLDLRAGGWNGKYVEGAWFEVEIGARVRR